MMWTEELDGSDLEIIWFALSRLHFTNRCSKIMRTIEWKLNTAKKPTQQKLN